LTFSPYRDINICKEIGKKMLVKITSKRQVTFPASVLKSLGVSPGDRLEIIENADGFLIRPQRVDLSRLAPLRGKLAKGRGTFDLTTFRDQSYDPALRD
jgi:AbrB family looped-hinge helix DNA binding protein